MWFILVTILLSMSHPIRRNQIAQRVQTLRKPELFIHLITALRTECYLYASILRDEIQQRTFTLQEVKTVQNSSFYSLLNGVLDAA